MTSTPRLLPHLQQTLSQHLCRPDYHADGHGFEVFLNVDDYSALATETDSTARGLSGFVLDLSPYGVEDQNATVRVYPITDALRARAFYECSACTRLRSFDLAS